MGISKAYSVVKLFEDEIANWCGAKYGVAVESCCAALFLCIKYFNPPHLIELPKHTYPGVASAILNAGSKIKFTDEKWKSQYQLRPLPIIDSALRFEKGMYLGGFECLSFHYKKLLPIGRGGMILTNDDKAVEWFKMARFDGRKEISLNEDNATILGWNFYMTPDQAARGLALFECIKHSGGGSLKSKDQNYPDLSKWEAFK